MTFIAEKKPIDLCALNHLTGHNVSLVSFTHPCIEQNTRDGALLWSGAADEV